MGNSLNSILVIGGLLLGGWFLYNYVIWPYVLSPYVDNTVGKAYQDPNKMAILHDIGNQLANKSNYSMSYY